MRRALVFVACALVFVALSSVPAQAQNSLAVVTSIPGGGPSGQPEDATCVQEGSYGLRTYTQLSGGTQEVYVEAGATQGFDHESTFRAAFWFDPYDFDGLHGIRHFILNTINDAGTGAIRPVRVMYIRNVNMDKHQIRAICAVNTGGGAYRGTGTLDLAPGWNQIQIEVAHNTQPAPAPADGLCRLSIVGGANAGATAELTGIRNSLFTIGKVRIGRMGAANFHPSANGYQCFDAFESYRTLAP